MIQNGAANPPSTTVWYLVFSLDGQRFAVAVRSVKRVVRMVEITPLHAESQYLRGVIDVEGIIVPAYDTRRILGLPEKDIDLTDHLIIATVGERSLALIVDSVLDVRVLDHTSAAASGTVATEDGIVSIQALESFLQGLAARLQGGGTV
ncbi:MAG: chemotaxis protein CheW [Bacillota bacterium]|nr:chemotaxis protein CheW [Bacillota bacterium]